MGFFKYYNETIVSIEKTSSQTTVEENGIKKYFFLSIIFSTIFATIIKNIRLSKSLF